MNHYEVLQVTRDAEPEVIERAFKALSRKYHPDLGPAEERVVRTRRMAALNEAYRVLRDPVSRRHYDVGISAEGSGAHAWEQFMERGLVGLFVDALRARRTRK